MKSSAALGIWFAAALLLGGCATSRSRTGFPPPARMVQASCLSNIAALPPAIVGRILALDPDRLTERDVRDVLAQAPAPRIVNIHGGRYPVFRHMISFSEFLVGMGYPRASLVNPGDGTYSFSGYDSSKKIAGAIAWYYEREGLRPMMVGHSLGGFQTVKVLQQLAGREPTRVRVWNPLLGEVEPRWQITDPFTGRLRPVVGLQLPFATAVGSGGLTRFMPNQWDMCGKLRSIPDSVEEFTGFYIGLDLLGGDWFGFGPANHYGASGQAVVRNVELPTGSNHGTVPITHHLLDKPEIVDWIHRYVPTEGPQLDPSWRSTQAHILWAAEVWFSIKKHWLRELQRAIRACGAAGYVN